MVKTLLFALSCGAATGVGVIALNEAQQAPQPFTTHAIARVIDVVARDKKGKPVTGLRQEDFRLTENGVVQEILDFASVTPGNLRHGTEGIPLASTAAADDVPAPTHRANVDSTLRLTTAIVFERLTPESREPARVAALKMLEGDGNPEESVGVFVLDLSLRTIQPFTSDRALLRKAAALASTMATSYYEPNRAGLAAGKAVDYLDIAESSEDLFKDLTRIQQGYSTATALQALATAMGVIPGRKTILYFSDGLPAQSDANKVRLDQAIATANRYNVAIYPVDAVGLRVHSQNMANGEALRRAALSDMDAAGRPGNDLGGGGASYVGEYILRSGTTSAVFKQIASRTGGFVVEDTNDLRRGVAAINADRRFYYLLTYNPTNKELDGTWRAVTVTVSKRNVTIRARSGYLATDGK